MMMLMKTVVLVVVAVVVPSVLPVVQAETKTCDGLAKKECKKEKHCTFFPYYPSSKECVLTVGKDSVVRQGDKNVAPGLLCTVGGGKNNLAGFNIDIVADPAESYNVVGGGVDNLCLGTKNTISGGKSNEMFYSLEGGRTYNTISGGSNNVMSDSTAAVITGGGGDGLERKGNAIGGSNTSTISGGSRNDIFGAGHTVTGGLGNSIIAFDFGESFGVVTGGTSNAATQGAVIMGGQSNYASGKNSIALGQYAAAAYDHSMVVNLMEPNSEETPLEATEAGHFLVHANNFRFQVGNGESATLTAENINLLKKELLLE